jgi:hypothetical protein
MFESSSNPRGSGEAGLAPEGSGNAEPMPEGLGELETPSVGPDWAPTTLTIVPDRLRLMSFNFCLLGTLILVPDRSIPSIVSIKKRARLTSTNLTRDGKKVRINRSIERTSKALNF